MKLFGTKIDRKASNNILKNHYELKMIGGVFHSKYIKCKSNNSKKLSIEQHLESNNKHYWTPLKYCNVLQLNRTQKQLRHVFLNILQKYYQLHILGTLDTSGHFHQKQ